MGLFKRKNKDVADDAAAAAGGAPKDKVKWSKRPASASRRGRDCHLVACSY